MRSTDYVTAVAEALLDTTDPNATDLQAGGQRINGHFHNYEGLRFTNQTGGALAEGEVVAISDSHDAGVELDDVQASTRTFVCAAAAIDAGAVGEFARCGYVVGIGAQGVIPRGQWIRKSATSKKVEDTGTAITSAPPAGTIGFSVKAAASSLVDAYLLGYTVASSGSPARASFRGLRVFNDPAAPNSKVRIVCDEAILIDSSGVPKRVTSVDVVPDLSASGENGLDTGAEASSTEYDLYLAGKSDGTVCGLFSKGLQWVKDQDYSDANRDGVRGLRSAAGSTYVAQGFQVATSGKLHSIEFSLLRVGSPTGSLWAEIWSDSGGNPSAVITGGRAIVVPVGDLDATNRVRFRFVFPERPSLTSGTQYHAVLRGDFAVSGANYVDIGVDASAPSYANGQIKTGDATPTWSAQTEDAALFTVNTLTGAESVTLPTGYTYSGRVSWNRNDGASNLLRMAQDGATWHLLSHTETAFTVSLVWTAYDFATLACAAWARAYLIGGALNGAQLVVTPATFPLGSPAITTVITTKQRGPGWSGNSGGVSSEVVRKPGFLGPMFWATVSAGSGHVFSIQGQELEVAA